MISAMKRKLLIPVLILMAFTLYSQVPEGFTYQSVARNSMGNPIADVTLTVKIGITSDAAGLVYVWEEQHSVTTNSSGLFSLVVGDITATRLRGSALTFSAIDWAAEPLYIKTSIQYQGTWHSMSASKLWSVPYSMLSARSADFAGTFTYDGDTIVIMQPLSIGSSDAGKALLAVTSLDDTSDDPLFEVKRKDGQTVFAVYNDAVNIYVPSAPSKGSASKGGFAIGSFDEAKKGISQDFFRVTPDSVRIYINDNPSFTKAAASKGGFAIGSFDEAKGMKNTYFNLTAASVVDTVNSRAQLLWYPKREALLAGRVHIGGADSVGQNSTALGYHSIAMGNWSQAFGYKARAIGTFSTAIGNSALARGNDSYAFGSGAEATGMRSFALGSVGVDASGNPTSRKTIASGPYSVAIGMGAQATTQSAAMALGTNSTASGFASTSIGYNSEATSHYAVAMGYQAKAYSNYSTAIGYLANASNTYAVALGSSAQATNTNALALGNGTIASGTNSTAMGFQSQAQGDKSIAIGSFYSYSYLVPIINLGKGDTDGGAKGIDDFLIVRPITSFTTLTKSFSRANIASGQYSVALGNGNLAQNGGMVFGSNSDAIKFGAVALGTLAKANETNSFAVGYNSVANGIYSTAIGNNIVANSYGEFALGQWNVEFAGTPDTWNDNELLFSLGNGVNADNRSNAMTIYKNGKAVLTGRYAVSTFNYQRSRFVTFPTFGLKDYVYGIYTNLNRDNTAIEYYYSGFFGSTGTAGTYYGLYADQRSGAAIDVAEYIYDTYGNTEAADVVVADPGKTESVIKSSVPYQTSVLGVVSTKPHLTMGMELVINEETGEPIEGVKATRLALTGRVPVKVTTENGPIKPGDLLTTSSTPGHAMKWSLLDVNSATSFEEMKSILAENEKRRNAIIGKALESHSSGIGKIVVLIALQ